MARWENEDVSGLNLPDENKTNVEYYDKFGKLSTEDIAYAKYVSTWSGLENLGERWYIKFYRGEIVDPHMIDSNAKNKTIQKFKKVSKQAFNAYLTYLKTKNRLHFTHSRRLAMMEK